jgi:hypothetical protein
LSWAPLALGDLDREIEGVSGQPAARKRVRELLARMSSMAMNVTPGLPTA